MNQQQSITIPILKCKKQTAIELLLMGNLQQAQKIYQNLIQSDVCCDSQNFIGLGSIQERAGYSITNTRSYLEEMLPSNPSSYDCLSLCLSFSLDYNDGLQWYTRMVDKYPQSIELQLGLAHLYYNSSQHSEASQIYLKVIELDSNCERAYTNLALLNYFTHFNSQTSLKYAQKAVQLRSQNMQAEMIIILIKYDNQLKQQKLKALQAKYPRYIRIINNIGKIYISERKFEESIAYFEECISICPAYGTPYYNIAMAHFQLGNPATSLQYLQICCEKDPSAHYCYIFIAQIYRQAYNDHDKAKSYYQKALNFKSSQYMACIQLGKISNAAQQYATALDWFQRCIKIAPTYYLSYQIMGIIFQNMERQQQAITYYEKSFDLNCSFENMKSLIGVADCFFKLKQYAQAKKTFLKCFEMRRDSLNVMSYCRFATIFAQEQSYQTSMLYMKEALEQYPSKHFLNVYIGKLYLMMNKFEEAESYFDKSRILFEQGELYEQNEQEKQEKRYLLDHYGYGQNWIVRKQMGEGCQSQNLKFKVLQQKFEFTITKLLLS